MTPAARVQATVELLEAIDLADRPADRVAQEYFRARRYIGAKDRAAVSERAFGVLRRRGRLDWWIARARKNAPDPGAGARGMARARVIADLLLGDSARPQRMRDLFNGDRFAPPQLDGPERALVRAVAGQSLEDARQPPWSRLDYPKWINERLRRAFGPDLETEMAALREKAPLDLRVNSLKGERKAAIRRLAEAGVETAPTPHAPLGLRAVGNPPVATAAPFKEGLVEVQDEGSQIIALLADARPGMRVVDFCAGAGGKTLALAAAMKNKGRLVACDISAARMARSVTRLRRAGVGNVERRVLTGERDRWVKQHRAGFDRVLIDAPCSGIGAWRRNPDGKWRLSSRDIEELAATQTRIVDSASRLVRPGGRLVYVTCSLLREENEAQVARLEGKGWRPMPVPAVWRETVGTACPVETPTLTLTPARHGTDGFFCAILERSVHKAEVSGPSDDSH